MSKFIWEPNDLNIKLTSADQPLWTSTWTCDDHGSYCGPKAHNAARSYFMRPRGRYDSVDRNAPWIRKSTNGWDVMQHSEVVKTWRLKDEAQRHAEHLAGIDMGKWDRDRLNLDTQEN